MNKTKRNTFLLGIGVLATGTLMGTFSYAQQTTPEKMTHSFVPSTYQEFVKKVEGTKREGKVSEEKFESLKTKLELKKEKQKERFETMKEHREKVQQAIQNHDYEAWKELMSQKENKNDKSNIILEKINTPKKFEKLIEMHSIMQEAKEKSGAIAKELGLSEGKKPGRKGMRHIHHNIKEGETPFSRINKCKNLNK